MHIRQERSALASYDIDRRPRAQPRDGAAQGPRSDTRAALASSRPLQQGTLASQALELNQQQSSMQSAQVYLGRLATHLNDFKRDLGRALNGSASGAPDNASIARSVTQLNALLDSRARISGTGLDAHLDVNFDEPQRSRFSIKGLESLQGIQASGSETLLFNAGRHLPGPMAVVLDDGMSDAQTLRRFNVGLAPAGLHVEPDEGGRLQFSAVESRWNTLKGQLSVQGEDKLFAKGGFTPVVSQEDNLLGTPLPTPQEGRADLGALLDIANQGLQRINGVIDQLHQHQAQALDQLGRQESREEKRWAHDFVGRAFARDESPVQFKRVAQMVMAQSHVSRHTVLGLMA
ncbi:hypothetical protein PS627_00126 [Pseudomonas fluorescens]|uniref:hypothetical protein n=1 Tax=Pseudomonas fluorescens TaxID=294 RepID=UPI0012585285|nr:hypothetical protein [Pseudomonas fluorescens]CAG8863190.1 hypothetical protein PS627_00126 [Pseudomonas fluorescens]VVP69002.1 hypothetical protein PS910_00486 [Pseudomonas fluorescens]